MNTRLLALVGLLFAGLALFGCGGREARPVAKTTSFDEKLTCDHIQSQLETNRERIADLGVEEKRRRDLQVGTFPFAAPLYLLQTSREQEEIEALVERNGVLEDLARKKQCPPSENPAAAAKTSSGEAAGESAGETAEETAK